MLKILQARLQQYVNRELPDIQAGFRKRGTKIKLPTSTGSSKNQENSRKTSISALLTMPKCQEPVRLSTHDKGHEEGGSAYSKAGSSLRSPPGYSQASTPKNQSLPTLLLCALTSDFTGGCPPPPSRSLCQRVNL